MNTTPPLQVYARAAGLTYIVVILMGVFGVSYIDTRVIVPQDIAATLENITEHEFQFRISALTEVLMYLLVVPLSLSLFVILRSTNKHLALLALLWRLAEAIIGAVIAFLGCFAPLVILSQQTGFEVNQQASLVAVFLGLRSAGLDAVLLFIGFGGSLFCYLFFKSRSIPRILSVWGGFTYLSMLVLGVAGILRPHLSETFRIALYIPGGLFEIAIGFWLLVKGVNIEHRTQV